MVERHILHLPIRPIPCGFSPLCSFILPTWDLKAFESGHWFLFRCHKSVLLKRKANIEFFLLLTWFFVLWHLENVWPCRPCLTLFPRKSSWDIISKSIYSLTSLVPWYGSIGSSYNLPQPLWKAFLFSYIYLYMICSFWKRLWGSL